MPNENEVVVQPAGEEASSPEAENQENQGTQTPPAKEGEAQKPEETKEQFGYDDPRHPLHNQWRALQDEKHWVRQQQEKLLAQPQQPIQQPTPIDPYQGMTPEERVFYENQDKRIRQVAGDLVKEKEKEFQKALLQRDQIIGNLLTKDFRRSYPDIKAGSEEEGLISQKIQQGYNADDAYKIVMFDRQTQAAQIKVKQEQKSNLQAKKAANMETTSTPQNSGLPPKKESIKELAGRLFDEEVKKGWE